MDQKTFSILLLKIKPSKLLYGEENLHLVYYLKAYPINRKPLSIDVPQLSFNSSFHKKIQGFSFYGEQQEEFCLKKTSKASSYKKHKAFLFYNNALPSVNILQMDFYSYKTYLKFSNCRRPLKEVQITSHLLKSSSIERYAQKFHRRPVSVCLLRLSNTLLLSLQQICSMSSVYIMPSKVFQSKSNQSNDSKKLPI